MTDSTALPIPGSVYLVDVQHQSDAPHLHKSSNREESEIVLNPPPSRDVNDPLNWSRRRKILQVACVMLYTTAIGIGTTVFYSILEPISDDTGIPLATLNQGTGYTFLLLGWGALINQPLALTFGKRGVYLLSVLGNIAVCMWTPYIKSQGQWIASHIVQGLVCTPVESLCEVSISDIFFTHERGRYIGMYTLFLFGSNYFAPMISGFIYDGQGWNWVMYWAAIINAVSFVLLFFLMEETNYTRSQEKDSNVSDEKRSSSPSEDSKGLQDVKIPSASPAVISVHERSDELSHLTGTPSTYLSRLAIFNKRFGSNDLLLTMTWRPIALLRFPVVFWAGFEYGTCLVWYNVLNATCSLILSAAPYNFRASFVGLAYLGPLVGMLIGTFYSGYIGDLFSLLYARRKAGVREPEDRLWLMSVCLLLCPASLILWGVGAAHGAAWPALVVGMGMISCSTGVGSALSIGYALDAYREMAGEVMMAVIIVRNTLSFAIGYGINPWLGMGLQNTFICAAFVGMGINMTFLGVMRWGKGWRRRSAGQYWAYVEQGGTVAH
ncbi:MFS transporter [Coniophora puteana RWD-64-598 SS2]|uniref:MFS transporter n=1 Tax=Coniophora puteana (strain RWD-64-598) TaxID=741705 RepID=A0A5M3MZE8_CONPW|nr:MFS transporter [Coniophora puteana RWD-64-598 SS2]EIW84522.1 MFS transporter [Coniophora puteana RWD-64-598 SS2]